MIRLFGNENVDFINEVCYYIYLVFPKTILNNNGYYEFVNEVSLENEEKLNDLIYLKSVS